MKSISRLSLAILLFQVLAFAAFAKKPDVVTMDSLEKKARQQSVKSVAEFLGLLPSEWRSNYVLMEKSRSMQEGSLQNPRVILYSDDGKMIFAFNGHKDQRGYDSLESIEYNSAEKGYTFRQLTFPEDGGVSTMQVVKNPAVCTKCHGAELRPNWESYNSWPGAIGTTQELTRQEEEVLNNFISTGSGNERYRQLNREKNVADVVAKILRTSPAFSLDILLARQKIAILAHRIMSSPDYKKYKYAIMGSLAACSQIESFFPAQITWATPGKLDEYYKSTTTSFAKVSPPHKKFIDLVYNDNSTKAVARLRWIFESRGIIWQRWGFSKQSPYLIDATSVETRYLLEAINTQDPDFKIPYEVILKNIFNEYSLNFAYHPELAAPHVELCSSLKAKSLKALQ